MLTLKTVLMDESAMRRSLMRLSHEIVEKNKGAQEICLIGILRRGETLSRMIRENIRQIEGIEVPCGSVDIGRYRDDLTPTDATAQRDGGELSVDVEGRTVILVDDVLYTGRTARAAMEAVIAKGRPKAIQLAVLIDRGHRELPIRADYVGKNVPTARGELIEVRVPPFDDEARVCLMSL